MARSARLLLQTLLAFTMTAVLSATSIVVVSDETLVQQSDLIVRGMILSTAQSSDGPRTLFTVSPLRVLKGQADHPFQISIPGGETPDGRSILIHGAPRFIPGEEVLLFLGARSDGSYEPLHLMLGAFHLTGSESDGHAVRDFSDVRIVEIEGLDIETSTLRNRKLFEEWVDARIDGKARSADYFVARSPYANMQAPFTLFTDPGTSLNIRWFAFDAGNEVYWHFNPPAFAKGGPTIRQMQNAIEVWNQVPGANIRYRAVGTTSATGGLTDYDGVNAVVFGDPHGEANGTFSCTLGGVLAIGGPWYGASRASGDRNAHETLEADVVFNDGVECLMDESDGPLNFEEVMAHELGHTLGFNHSCEDSCGEEGSPLDDALMRAYSHFDGRGARIGADDIAAAVALYPAGDPQPVQPRRRSVRRP